MELLAVPQAVMPRAVSPSREGNKRGDDGEKMSNQGPVRPQQSADDRTPARKPDNSTDTSRGMAGLTALAKRIKSAPKDTERSIHKQQEARTRMMRDKLQQTYNTQADPAAEPKHRQGSLSTTALNRSDTHQRMETMQARHPDPIHLVV